MLQSTWVAVAATPENKVSSKRKYTQRATVGLLLLADGSTFRCFELPCLLECPGIQGHPAGLACCERAHEPTVVLAREEWSLGSDGSPKDPTLRLGLAFSNLDCLESAI